MATTARGIWTPDSGDGYDLTVDFAAMADTIDDALDDVDADVTAAEGDITDLETAMGLRAVYTYRPANAAALAAITGMRAGDIAVQIDTEATYRYNGTSWRFVLAEPAMGLVLPASVSAGSTLASGLVSFSAQAAVSVNGCFTAAYTNYVIMYDLITSGAVGISSTLRVAGTDATSAYDSQRLLASSATASAAQSLNSAAFVMSGGLGVAGARQFGEMKLFGPAVAAATAGTVETTLTPNPMTTSAGYYKGGLLHRTATAYDGFTFTPVSGTVTGTLVVYGYNKGEETTE